MNSEKTAILVLSKPLEGKKEFLDDYIKKTIKENKAVLFVLTDKTSAQIKKELLKEKIFFKNLYFVDCYSQQAGEECKNGENIQYVSGPLALNELSIAIADFEREFIRKELKHIIIFDSLSTLLLYSNSEAIARFLQILIARIKKFGGEVFFTAEEGMHDLKAITAIEHLMDVIIEVKKEKGKVLFKTKGKDSSERWIEMR